MNEFKLSKRLESVASFVPKGANLADIGSDHAYLPTYLALEGRISKAIAVEVVQGPFQSAKRQIEESQVSEIVEARLASGLDAINEADGINCVTIAGMGGTLIREILEDGWNKGKLKGITRLVLQPNVGERNVREWIALHQFKIIDEKILEENGKIYEIVVAEPSQTPVSLQEKEALFGLYLPKERSDVFVKKWEAERETCLYVLDKLRNAVQVEDEKIHEFEGKLQMINEVLDDEGK